MAALTPLAAAWLPPTKAWRWSMRTRLPSSQGVSKLEPATPVDPDLPLLEQMARGEQSALAELMQRHGRRLHRAVASLLCDAVEAEDVCQETFLQAWRQAASWQAGRARFASWLQQVALNAARDRLRRRRPEVPVDPEWQTDPNQNPAQLLDRQRRTNQMIVALSRLPPRQRAAIALFHQAGFSQQEAAAAMDISIEALESLLSRARRQLRLQLAAADDQALRQGGSTGAQGQ